ncbi:MAG: hypothetical protein JW850_15755 [Thermoflexales bacterium]|nr:hypothetical protein [Thermoflexales bacterium]
MDWLDIPEYFDPINRIEGAVSTFLNADWYGAIERRGLVGGILFEFVACLTNYNAPTIRVARGDWRGIDIERLLRHHGVKVWDRGLANSDEIYFCVKRRQVRWADYVLRRAGVPVTSQRR